MSSCTCDETAKNVAMTDGANAAKHARTIDADFNRAKDTVP